MQKWKINKCMYTRVNKNPSAWNSLSPKPEVTCCTVAIIIRVVLLSPYLRIRAISLSSIHYNQPHRVYINRRQYICLTHWNTNFLTLQHGAFKSQFRRKWQFCTFVFYSCKLIFQYIPLLCCDVGLVPEVLIYKFFVVWYTLKKGVCKDLRMLQ